MHLHYPVKPKYIKAFLNEYGNTVKTAVMGMLKNGPCLCERQKQGTTDKNKEYHLTKLA